METELKPVYDGRKSFWRRAYVDTHPGSGLTLLRSYGVAVGIVDAGGRFHRTWSGYSRTTMRHVVEFVRQYASRGPLSKREWEDAPVEPLFEIMQAAERTKNDLLSMEAK